MIDIYINLSATPLRCDQCGKKIRTGGRVVTDGQHNFDTCQCESEYDK